MSKGFNNTDWLKYINNIETMSSMKDACIRYEKDLVSIISKNRKFKKPPVLMLSGGIDSMMLGTVLKKHFDLKQTFSFASVLDTNDIIQSQKSAKSLGVDNKLIVIPFDEIIENLHLVRGKKIDSVNSLMCYLMFKLGLQKAKVRKLKRKASQAVIGKRAQRSARNVFKKRFGQGKAYRDLSAGQKQIVDKKVNVKKPAIGRLKKRLVKVKRKLDIGRKR